MERNDERGRNIPENDPSKAMDSKKEVEKSKDPRTDQDFPGYPHYPSKEDIMDQRTDIHRVDMNVDDLAANTTGVNQRFADASDRAKEQVNTDEIEGRAGNTHRGDEAERARGENVMLNTEDEIGTPQNVSNEDLGKEIPGTDLDRAGSENPEK